MCMSAPSAPTPPPPPPAPPPQPTKLDEGVKKRREDTRRRAGASAGRSSTVLTGAQGLADTQASTAKKNVLGA